MIRWKKGWVGRRGREKGRRIVRGGEGTEMERKRLKEEEKLEGRNREEGKEEREQ